MEVSDFGIGPMSLTPPPPAVLVHPEDAESVKLVFRKQYNIALNWKAETGFTFNEEMDRTIFNLLFIDDWVRPFLITAQICDIDIMCCKIDGSTVSWINGRLIMRSYNN